MRRRTRRRSCGSPLRRRRTSWRFERRPSQPGTVQTARRGRGGGGEFAWEIPCGNKNARSTRAHVAARERQPRKSASARRESERSERDRRSSDTETSAGRDASPRRNKAVNVGPRGEKFTRIVGLNHPSEVDVRESFTGPARAEWERQPKNQKCAFELTP